MNNIVALEFSDPQIKIMKQTVAAGVSDAEFFFFLEVCKARGLNPFNREIYAIPRSGKLTIQVSIDGLRILAERSGKYRGQIGPQFCAADGQWRDEWLADDAPVAARIGVLRSDFDKPIWSVARYKAYAQPNNPLWKSMPEVMLQKCAEALALRKAFPQAMAGLYAHEEMMQADGASERIIAPSLKMLYIKCQDSGLYTDADAFYSFCGDVLDRKVTRENGTTVTPEERIRLGVAIDNAISELHPVVVQAEQDAEETFVSIDDLSKELASK